MESTDTTPLQSMTMGEFLSECSARSLARVQLINIYNVRYNVGGNALLDCNVPTSVYEDLLNGLRINPRIKSAHKMNKTYSIRDYQLKLCSPYAEKCYRIDTGYVTDPLKCVKIGVFAFLPIVKTKTPISLQEFPSYDKYDFVERNDIWVFEYMGVKIIMKTTVEDNTKSTTNYIIVKYPADLPSVEDVERVIKYMLC